MTATPVTTTAVDRRYDFVLLFDVMNGNPNGDPDAGNSPRVDPETGRGLVSDVCLKRKIRNFITLVKSDGTSGKPEDGYDIYVKERAILNQQHERAYRALGLKPGAKGGNAKSEESPDAREQARPEDAARRWMCQTFFDVRMFGAVMSTGVNAGQVRGPVQITFSRSIDPITSLEQSITRMAVTTDEEAKKQDGGNRTMGRKEIVPYGLYRAHGFVNPHLAAQTGFSGDDLELLWQALEKMFEFDRSSARGEMATRRLIVFAHESALGNAPAHRLFDRVRVRRRDVGKPPREYEDYDIVVDADALPDGVRVHDRV